MTGFRYNIIQVHVVVTLLGYWLLSAFLAFLVGETTSAASIAFRGFHLLFSLYIIYICNNGIKIENNRSMLKFYVIILIAYSIRILIDFAIGPFSLILSTETFFTDILYNIFGIFIPTYAVIVSRKYLDIDMIVNMTFWVGLVIIALIMYNQGIYSNSNAYEETRLDGGRGLGTLAISKIGLIEILAALHIYINNNMRKRYISIIGIIAGGWLTLSSGSRGGLVSCIIALGYVGLFASKKHKLTIVLYLIMIGLMLYFIIPILEWLANYFPIIAQRLLNSIIENDQSGREELRTMAYELIFNNPLFGYSYRLGPYETGYGCHNGLLDIMLALGIPAGLLFIYFIYVKVIIITSKLAVYKQLFFPVSLSIYVIVHSMSGAGITNNIFGVAICLLAVSYYYIYNKKRSV